MKKLILILLLFTISSFAQTRLDTKSIRNNTDTLSFSKVGDYSSDAIYLTIKRKNTSSDRLVDHLADSIYYNSTSGISTIYFYLLPRETSTLNYGIVVYDVAIENSSTDHRTLFYGTLYVTQQVRLDSDSAPEETSPIVVLTPNDYESDTWLKIEDDGSGSNNIIVPKTDAEVKSALGIIGYPITGIFSGYITNYGGTKTQTINGTIINQFTGVTPTITYGSTGLYTIALGTTSALSKGFGKIQLEYNSILNALPTNYTVDIDETAHGWSLQFKASGVNADLPTSLDIINFKFLIQQWKQ